MMFLEYVIWGSWLPLLALHLSKHLGFRGTEIGWIFATQAIASVTAVLVSGQIADRYVSAERFLAASHVVGGLALLALALQKTFWPFFVIMLVYSLAYVPTLSLTNAIALRHVSDASRDFGIVRLWGTVGWIAASWPFFFIFGDKEDASVVSIFVVAGLASLALAAVALWLPAGEPRKGADQAYAPLAAIRLLSNPTIAVLFVVTFLDALVHQCYFQWTGAFLQAIGVPVKMIMPAMSIGQIAEIATMAGLGWFLSRLGWRWTMTIGILGHVVRFFIYSRGGPVWLVVGSNVVHGLCYAFFFASVYIFVDDYFPKDARASAQGLFNLLILGLGPFVGSLLWGYLGDVYRHGDAVDYGRLFVVPAAVGLLAAALLFVGFHPRHPPRPALAKAA
jgi:nucleoside transporter